MSVPRDSAAPLGPGPVAPVGRPRSARVDAAVRAATHALLLEVGYPKLSMELVAARAGVGKSALYRRWSSKAELVFVQVLHDLDWPDPQDAGSLRDDLALVIRDLAAGLSGPVAAAAVPGVIADMAAQPEVRRLFVDTVITRGRGAFDLVLGRAVARGELVEVPDVAVVQVLVIGPLLTWLTVLGDAPHPTQVDLMISVVVQGLLREHGVGRA